MISCGNSLTVLDKKRLKVNKDKRKSSHKLEQLEDSFVQLNQRPMLIKSSNQDFQLIFKK